LGFFLTSTRDRTPEHRSLIALRQLSNAAPSRNRRQVVDFIPMTWVAVDADALGGTRARTSRFRSTVCNRSNLGMPKANVVVQFRRNQGPRLRFRRTVEPPTASGFAQAPHRSRISTMRGCSGECLCRPNPSPCQHYLFPPPRFRLDAETGERIRRQVGAARASFQPWS